jgi:putative component of toxin-antitoxin plasmid stabilization module
MPFTILHYLAPDGRDLFQDWLDRVRDAGARKALLKRVDRVAMGLFGDHAFCRDGVWELRVDVGQRTQDGDIGRAVGCWQDFLRRTK